MRNGRNAQSGFSYLFLLVLLAVISVVSAGSLSLGSLIARRLAEAELLAIGTEYERALASYTIMTPAGLDSRGPTNLAELLRDPRYMAVKRHLRRIYTDPLTGLPSWGSIRSTDGRIVGIYSLAEGIPIQQSGFFGSRIGFNLAKSYSDWCVGNCARMPVNQLLGTPS